MRIALTGASGFIGSVVAKHAAAAGHEVTALVRPTSRSDHITDVVSRFVEGTHDDPIAIASLLDAADAVIHDSFDWDALSSDDLTSHVKSNIEGSIALLDAAEQRPFVYMSSVAVHHAILDRWCGSIDSDHPTRPGSGYGAAKATIESHLWARNAERGQPFTIIRPCAVYGIDPAFDRTIGVPIIETLRSGQPYARSGGGKFVHVDDVAQATLAAIDHRSAIYHLVDCYARWGDWATMTAELLDIDADIDLSSPASPRNMFDTTNVTCDLGVPLDRGHAGIRDHLRMLIEAIP
ncbi:MAG: NAD(P)-dependent oxidoreductase [Phycisphaerales bacterium]|jgi:nucleoside-diphosphate-sugar epimerase|nr:NAD(P)-dependent oxidoreductase [Phycisphaerales bacterium]